MNVKKYLSKFFHPFSALSSVRELAICGLLLALCVVLARFGTFYIGTTVKIEFYFIAVLAAAILYGPVMGGLVGAMGDVLSWVLTSTGPFFPGFTISYFLTGVIYGLFLYREAPKLWRAVAGSSIKAFFISSLLNTFWLKILYGYGFLGMLPSRLVKAGMMLPVEIMITMAILKVLPMIKRKG